VVKRNVGFDASVLLEHLQDAIGLVSGKKRDLMKMGRDIMRDETVRAFQTQSDPSTGSRWPRREHSYPWPMLFDKGDLFSALDWGYGVRTRDGKPRFFGKVADNYIVIAGATHFGRSKRRSSKGTRMRAPGGGFLAPRSGVVPPRPFFGFSNSAKAKFKRQAERRIGRVFR